jgi:hypothetical protein
MLVVEVTEHAIKRYGERVRPALGASELEGEVLRVIHDVGEVSWHPLDWLAGAQPDRTVGFVNVGSDIAFPLQFHRERRGVLVATTCLTRSTFGEGYRQARNHKAACRRAARALKRRDSLPSTREAA